MRECCKLNKNLKKNKIKTKLKIRNKKELKEMIKNNLTINRNKMMIMTIIMIKKVIFYLFIFIAKKAVEKLEKIKNHM